MPQITLIAANSSHPRLLNPELLCTSCDPRCCDPPGGSRSGRYRIQGSGRIQGISAPGVYMCRQMPSGPTSRQTPPGLAVAAAAGLGVAAAAGADATAPADA